MERLYLANEIEINHIRQELRARGWSQKNLAEKLRIHPVTLGLILTGKNKLTPQLAAHIELIFKSTSAYMIERPENAEQDGKSNFMELSTEHRLYVLHSLLNDMAQWLHQEYSASDQGG